jgi:hypothetical protein
MSPDDDDATRIIPAARSGEATPTAPVEAHDGDATLIRVPSGGGDATRASGAPAAPDAATQLGARAPAPPPKAAPAGGNNLPVGTFLGEFELTEVLGEGGFGIVYLARDHSLHRRVALKEYMPSSLAARVGGTQVSVKSERHRETFEAGLHSFVNEARLLASFDHPSLVKVYRFWEANGTAYMVMPFYEGITLKQQLKDMGGPPDEAWLRDLLEPLTEALAVIHAEQCYHRDIAPDNVILLKGSERPLLLDFGAARRVIGDMTQALTVILKPGYAPVEQYAEVPGMKQGAWTDVYALAAVVYFAVLGKTPPTSVGRLMNDSYVPLSEAAAGRYSPEFLAAIDRALAVKPDARTQSIDALRVDLGMEALAAPQAEATRRRGRGGATVIAGGARTGGAGAVAPKSRTPLIVGAAAVGALAIGGGLYAFLGGGPGKAGGGATTVASAPAGAAPSTAAVPVGATPATATAPSDTTAAPATAGPVATAPTTTATAAPGGTPLPADTGPLDPPRDFERIVAGQSGDFHVDATLAKQRMRIGKDSLSMTIKTEKDGYLYVLLHGTDDVVLQLWPNQINKNNRVRAGQSVTVPPHAGDGATSWDLGAATGPAGTDTIIAIVSTNPRDFSATGMKVSDRFLQTTRAAAAEVARRDSSGKPFFLGKPVCKEPCADEYGARVFTAEEVN